MNVQIGYRINYKEYGNNNLIFPVAWKIPKEKKPATGVWLKLVTAAG